MFMVILLHSSFLAFGMPEMEDIQTNPLLWGGRILQQAISIVAVDVFVLISGWFGIKPKLKSICSFLFQVAFLQIVSYMIFVSLGLVEFDKENLSKVFMLGKNQGWFVKAYLLLYIISPVLNTFVQYASKTTFNKVLVAYWSFLFLLGWVYDATDYINNGYSVVPFIGLYLLARYMRIWSPSQINKDKMNDIGIYALCCICFFTVIMMGGLLGIRQTSYFAWKLCSYVSPLTVLGAIYLLLFFSKLNIKHNKYVNLCGKSCFAVYLLHAFWGYWFEILTYIDSNYSGFIYVLLLFLFLFIVYFGCILVDMVRIKIWNGIERGCFK